MAKKPKKRFDLDKINQSLQEVQIHFADINQQLTTQREAFTDIIRENMIEAYSYLNYLIDEDKDIFADKGLQFMLEMNNIVLCGNDNNKRFEYSQFLKESKERFYSGIGPIQKWYKNHNDASFLKRASEIYVGIISSPQLFNEGNHRTGSLITSWILLKGGDAPFVLNIKNAVAFFEPSTHIKFTNKREIGGKLKLPKYKKEFKKFLEKYIDSSYLKMEEKT
jgi:hypothetical protein